MQFPQINLYHTQILPKHRFKHLIQSIIMLITLSNQLKPGFYLPWFPRRKTWALQIFFHFLENLGQVLFPRAKLIDEKILLINMSYILIKLLIFKII